MRFTRSQLSDAATLVERRRGYRQRVTSDALLHPLDETSIAPPIPVHLFELSMSGVGFAAAVAPTVGSLHRLEFADRKQSSRQVEIRSSRPRRDGMFDIGAQFC